MDYVKTIKHIITKEINDNVDLSRWRGVRSSYGYLSFTVFLVMIVRNLGWKCSNAESAFAYAHDRGLISEFAYDHLNSQSICQELIEKCDEELPDITLDDICTCYQEYIAQDYTVTNDRFDFIEGKSTRDSLGAYYTSCEFAETIVKGELDKWFEVNPIVFPRILDCSCGGGEFLIAVISYCFKRGIAPEHIEENKICGCDVDPLAVLITRYRIMQMCNTDTCRADIMLGNPLSPINEDSKTNSFKYAMQGRYYTDHSGCILEGEYDVILGNPPWEKIRFEEKKFLKPFASKELISEKHKRIEFIKNALPDNKEYFNDLVEDYATFKKRVKYHHDLKKSLIGELNTYALFTELTANKLSLKGISALIVKSSLMKMPVYKELFEWLVNNGKLYKVDFFVNRKKIFPIDSREEFAVIYLKKDDTAGQIEARFDLEDIKQFRENKKIINISPDFLKKVNPMTEMMPNIKDVDEIRFLNRVYDHLPCFENVYPNCRFGRLVHFTNQAGHIERQPLRDCLPIYEGKFIELYTGKFATFSGMPEEEKYKNKASARRIVDIHGDEYPLSRYYIEKSFWKSLSKNMSEQYSVMWRSLTSATNYRTMLATILPSMPTSQSIQLLQTDIEDEMMILAVFNSIVFDYIVRRKMAGLDLTQSIIKQIPVPEKDKYYEEINYGGKKASLKEHIISRQKYLYKDDLRLKKLFDGQVYYEIPMTTNNTKEVVAQLDHIIAYAYDITDRELRMIATTFDRFYTNNEIREWF